MPCALATASAIAIRETLRPAFRGSSAANASAVSDAPRTPAENLTATPYGARPIQLFEGSRR